MRKKNFSISRILSIYYIGISTILTYSTVARAWDYSTKGDLTHKSTDNVNASNTSLISDSINTISAYIQAKDENDRFRFKIKTNRYNNITANNSNSTEASYQRKFSDDLSDNFQVKIFKEKYTTAPLISGDVSSDNQGIEAQSYLAHAFKNDLILGATYLLNYKDYAQESNRKDYRLETIFGAEKIIKSVVTFAPDFSLIYNKSKDSYYSTFGYSGNVYIGLELSEDFEINFNFNSGKNNYQDRTFSSTVQGKSINKKESVLSNSFESGFNYYVTSWLTLSGKYAIAKSDSNNSENSYKSHDWSGGLSFKY